MFSKLSSLSVAALFFSLSLFGQEIEYNKKKNVFEVHEQAIAKFNIKSIGKGQGRSFFLTDLKDEPLLDIKLVALADTLFVETAYWYTVDSKPLNLHFTIENPAEINGEKYFSKFILTNQLVNTNGTLNEENVKKWAAENMYDFQSNFDRYNDSLKQFLLPELEFVKRKNGPIRADAMGRIGQSNVVIGKWEKFSRKERLGSKFIDYYIIKNNAGRVVATLNTEFSTTMWTFKKKRLSTSGISEKGIQRQSGEDDVNFMSRVAEVIVRDGLL